MTPKEASGGEIKIEGFWNNANSEIYADYLPATCNIAYPTIPANENLQGYLPSVDPDSLAYEKRRKQPAAFCVAL